MPKTQNCQASTSDLMEKLQTLDASCLCDIKKDVRLMSCEIRPLSEGVRMVGVARTVSVDDDFLTVIKAVKESQAGEVLVINGRGGKKAILGELFSAELQRRGVAGVVIDGACRDVRSIRELGFPVYTRHITPMAGTCKQLFETQTDITCGGVKVSPGDIVFGDDDGIVVLSEAEANSIVAAAAQLQATEQKVLQAIKSGTSLMESINAADHLKAVAEGTESKLCFVISDSEFC